MKKTAILFASIFLSLSVGTPALAQSQREMDEQADAGYQQADKKLNDTYQALLKQRKNDPLFIEKLKRAQKAWIAYRDAMVDLQYPVGAKANPQEVFGSIYPTCVSGAEENLTQTQTAMLSQWLPEHAAEGDACAGSKNKIYGVDR